MGHLSGRARCRPASAHRCTEGPARGNVGAEYRRPRRKATTRESEARNGLPRWTCVHLGRQTSVLWPDGIRQASILHTRGTDGFWIIRKLRKVSHEADRRPRYETLISRRVLRRERGGSGCAGHRRVNVSQTTVSETIAADYDDNYTTCLSGSPTSMDFLLIRMCVQCPRALQ